MVGTGDLGSIISEALAQAGVRVVAPESGSQDAVDLTIVVLEGATFGELLGVAAEFLEQNRVVLFVTVEGDSAVVGPVTVPGVSACLECRLRQGIGKGAGAAEVDAFRGRGTGRYADLAAGVADAICNRLIGVASDLTSPDQRTFTWAAICGAEGIGWATVLPSGRCRLCCAPVPPAASGAIGRASMVEVAARFEQEGFEGEMAFSSAPVDHPDRYRTVGILGGGTAGYLTALALRARLPELEVTLIESRAIPIISVGEATTPEMVKMLHSPAFLGFDMADFHERVRPSFKLGIQFLWGEPEGRFNYPFQYAPLADPMVHDGHLDAQNLASLLMANDRVPLIDAGGPEPHSLLELIRFAYHLDNERFVRFLTIEAVRRGVRRLDATIVAAETTHDGVEVDHLVTDDGRELRFDLYVDASGFRSVLLGGALRSPFVSYSSSLFTDRAIVANAPHGGNVKPYTRAHTLESGWCWTIPFEDSDHHGYVFSSAFSTDDEAEAEMRRVHPELGDTRAIAFRSGRHEHFFHGNVVAIGNAYGFVEPLESTALHMVIYELEHLTNHFPLRHDAATKHRLSVRMNDLWDELRWFLSIHYRCNRRQDSAFWREVRATADISGATERLTMFAERAPLSDRPSLFYSAVPPDFFAADHAFDTLLLGQGVAGRLGPPRHDPADWRRRASLRRQVAACALPQAEALPLLRDRHPDLLRRFVERPDSWLHQWIPR